MKNIFFLLSRKPLLQQLIVALVFVSLAQFVFPDELYSQDMVIHIPYIKKIQDAHLYPSDYLVNTWHTQKGGIYYPLLARVLPRDSEAFMSSLKIGYWGILFFTVWGLCAICYYFSPHFLTISLFAACLLFRFHIGGTATQLLEAELIPRAISTAFCVWSGYSLLKKKYVFGILLLSSSFLFHPSAPFSLMAIIGFSILLFKAPFKPIRKNVIYLLMVAPVVLGAYLVSTHQTMPTEWLQIMRERNKFAFIDEWSIKAWIALVILMLPAFGYAYLQKRQDKLSSYINVCTITALILTWTHFILAIVTPYYIVILAQLMRIWWNLAILSLIALVILLQRFLKNFHIILQVAFIVLVSMCGASYQYWQRNNFMVSQEWKEVQEWARVHTGVNCVYLTSFSSKGFRVGSERGTIAELKDGTLSAYTPQFASEWRSRKNVFNDWESYSDEKLIKLAEKYQFNYIVDGLNSNRHLPQVYENSKYRIYSVSNAYCLNI